MKIVFIFSYVLTYCFATETKTYANSTNNVSPFYNINIDLDFSKDTIDDTSSVCTRNKASSDNIQTDVPEQNRMVQSTISLMATCGITRPTTEPDLNQQELPKIYKMLLYSLRLDITEIPAPKNTEQTTTNSPTCWLPSAGQPAPAEELAVKVAKLLDGELSWQPAGLRAGQLLWLPEEQLAWHPPDWQPDPQLLTQPMQQPVGQTIRRPGIQTKEIPVAYPGWNPSEGQLQQQPTNTIGNQPLGQPGYQTELSQGVTIQPPDGEQLGQPAIHPERNFIDPTGWRPGEQPTAPMDGSPGQPQVFKSEQLPDGLLYGPSGGIPGQPPVQPGMRQEIQPEMQMETQPGMQPPVLQPEMRSPTQQALQPVMQPGVQPGAQSEGEPGWQPPLQSLGQPREQPTNPLTSSEYVTSDDQLGQRPEDPGEPPEGPLPGSPYESPVGQIGWTQLSSPVGESGQPGRQAEGQPASQLLPPSGSMPGQPEGYHPTWKPVESTERLIEDQGDEGPANEQPWQLEGRLNRPSDGSPVDPSEWPQDEQPKKQPTWNSGQPSAMSQVQKPGFRVIRPDENPVEQQTGPAKWQPETNTDESPDVYTEDQPNGLSAWQPLQQPGEKTDSEPGLQPDWRQEGELKGQPTWQPGIQPDSRQGDKAEGKISWQPGDPVLIGPNDGLSVDQQWQQGEQQPDQKSWQPTGQHTAPSGGQSVRQQPDQQWQPEEPSIGLTPAQLEQLSGDRPGWQTEGIREVQSGSEKPLTEQEREQLGQLLWERPALKMEDGLEGPIGDQQPSWQLAGEQTFTPNGTPGVASNSQDRYYPEGEPGWQPKMLPDDQSLSSIPGAETMDQPKGSQYGPLGERVEWPTEGKKSAEEPIWQPGHNPTWQPDANDQPPLQATGQQEQKKAEDPNWTVSNQSGWKPEQPGEQEPNKQPSQPMEQSQLPIGYQPESQPARQGEWQPAGQSTSQEGMQPEEVVENQTPWRPPNHTAWQPGEKGSDQQPWQSMSQPQWPEGYQPVGQLPLPANIQPIEQAMGQQGWQPDGIKENKADSQTPDQSGWQPGDKGSEQQPWRMGQPGQYPDGIIGNQSDWQPFDQQGWQPGKQALDQQPWQPMGQPGWQPDSTRGNQSDWQPPDQQGWQPGDQGSNQQAWKSGYQPGGQEPWQSGWQPMNQPEWQPNGTNLNQSNMQWPAQPGWQPGEQGSDQPPWQSMGPWPEGYQADGQPPWQSGSQQKWQPDGNQSGWQPMGQSGWSPTNQYPMQPEGQNAGQLAWQPGWQSTGPTVWQPPEQKSGQQSWQPGQESWQQLDRPISGQPSWQPSGQLTWQSSSWKSGGQSFWQPPTQNTSQPVIQQIWYPMYQLLPLGRRYHPPRRPASRDLNSYRLLTEIKPSHYTVTIHPDLDKESFNGEVSIYVRSSAILNKITLHSLRLNITETFINQIKCPFIYENYERVSLQYPQGVKIQPGEHRLLIKYSGVMQRNGTGFIPAPTNYENNEGQLYVTNCQPISARTIFPCFDEPNYKAKFNLRIITPNDTYKAIANMPEINNFKTSYGIVYDFATSQPMSTHWVTFAVTTYPYYQEIYHEKQRSIPVRIYAHNANKNKNLYAINRIRYAMEFYNGFTEVGYPLSKLDITGLDGDFITTLRSFGLLVSDRALLISNSTDHANPHNLKIRQSMYHESAYFWFGNLVTDEWWNNIWIRGGLANYMLYKYYRSLKLAVQPHKTVFFDGFGEANKAWPSRPIVDYLRTPDLITNNFDIVQNKSTALIHVIAHLIGQLPFQKVIQQFMKNFSYKTASTNDFIRSFEEVAPTTNIRAFLESYLYQTRFPLISIEENNGTFTLTQEAGPTIAQYYDSGLKWTIPITYKTNVKQMDTVWFDKDMDSLTIKIPKAKWMILNSLGTGLYRVKYSETLWETLIRESTKFPSKECSMLAIDATYSFKFHLFGCGTLINAVKKKPFHRNFYMNFIHLLTERLRCNGHKEALDIFLAFLDKLFKRENPEEYAVKEGTCIRGEGLLRSQEEQNKLQECVKWIKENLSK